MARADRLLEKDGVQFGVSILILTRGRWGGQRGRVVGSWHHCWVELESKMWVLDIEG